jgi:hypothetical protein
MRPPRRLPLPDLLLYLRYFAQIVILMSRDRTFRIARPSMTLRSLAGVFAGVLFSGCLHTAAALAQNPKPAHPGAVSHSLFAPRPAQQNAPPKKPADRPAGAKSAPQQSTPPAEEHPVPQRQLPQAHASTTPLVTPNRPGQTQQHLADWMQAHRNMPLADQQRALENEPGFRGLPAQEQQQLHQRLTQLNNMPAPQREDMIRRTEIMESLPPVQRQQIRNAMAQLGNLPEDRRNAVSRAFKAAISMPEPQRQAWLNSPQTRSQFNANERDTLNHLLAVQPVASQAGLPGFSPRPAPQGQPHE